MVYLFLADGFEEVEALCPLDLLRRAGITVQTVGVTGKSVRGAHGVVVQSDITAEQIVLDRDLEMVILPGGMPGASNLAQSREVKNAVSYAYENGRYVAAICAAPMILGEMGILEGRVAVCYPGFEKYLKGAQISQKNVVVDETVITAKAMGAAYSFGLTLTQLLCSESTAEEIKRSIFLA